MAMVTGYGSTSPPRRRSKNFTPQSQTVKRCFSSVQVLIQMGFSKERAEKAVAATGNGTAQEAAQWLLNHANDPLLDDQSPREYVLLMCPTGSVLQEIEQFYAHAADMIKDWDAAACRAAPHIPLTGFFPVRHAHVALLHDALRRVVDAADPTTRMHLEHAIPDSIVGLAVADGDATRLCELAASFAGDLAAAGIQVAPSEDIARRRPPRIALARNFAAHQRPTLERLCRRVDVGGASGTAWDVRLYSRDAGFSGCEAHRVAHNYEPVYDDELQLTIDDYVYVAAGALAASEDGWVSATSWRTGVRGMTPGNFLQRAPETCVWRLHRSYPVARVVVEAVNGVQGAPAAARRRLYVMRHGERVDFTFGGDWWIETCFDAAGNYVRVDANLPRALPRRRGGPHDYDRDAPLTEIGLTQARLVGDSLRFGGGTVAHAYVSPSLRCVQTADALLRALGVRDRVPLRVEPALFEWMGWYKARRATFMTPAEFADAGYNVDVAYCALVDERQLATAETLADYYARSERATRHAVAHAAAEGAGGDVLLVAHAASLEVNTRGLLGLQPRTYSALSRIMNGTPYCSLAALEEGSSASAAWSLVQPPCMPVTHMSNPEFDWTVLK
ncbi:PREDICTED: protein UBASH3A homolog [Priapulus caudatus]|uniref:Protein UBASH3A homolog n=1 Tax=Priapulus caudatus TaxID=37621 RepID=A0ABM1F322_PRICU|nr:PREDICTED: protein UBASH3A homolog [Priapulus caudatus]